MNTYHPTDARRHTVFAAESACSFFTAPNKKREQYFGEKQPNFVNFSGGEVRDENAILEKQNMKLEKDAMLRTPRDAVRCTAAKLRASGLWKAPSRPYGSRFVQPNIHFAAIVEI